nr:hypothetical protein [Tanacetum cinerariifolium]
MRRGRARGQERERIDWFHIQPMNNEDPDEERWNRTVIIGRNDIVYENRSNAITLDEAFSLGRAAEARFRNQQLWELLRSYHLTLREAFFRARITEARFEDENNQAVDTNIGDTDVKDKQEVKKANDQKIENIKVE